MRKGRWLGWLLGAVVMAAPASACELRVDLLQASSGPDALPIAGPVLRRQEADGPGEAVRMPLPHGPGAHWLRLACDHTVAADNGWRLVLQGASQAGTVVFHPPGAAPQHVLPADANRGDVLRRGWELPLPQGWPAGTVAYLRLDGPIVEPVLLRLVQRDALAREQRAEARLSIAVFTALALTALAMLGFYASFRDLLYLSYAGYLVCAALFLMLLSGDAAEMPGLAALAAAGPPVQWGLATLAVSLQLVFTRRILELDRLVPRAAHLLRALLAVHLLLLATLLVGGSRVHGWYALAGNALLVFTAPAVLAIALRAGRAGAAYAVYYLAGWLPLLVLVALSAANQLGWAAAPGAERGLPVAVLFESMVLALALSRHAANRHRIALLARQSHERDPLTGALSADALGRMLESWRQLGALGARRYCLLVLDLDDFAAVNAAHGRAVGDAALQQVLARLRAVLRPDDTVARLGGDSFAVITDCELVGSEALARRIADAIGNRPVRIDGDPIALSASIGLARALPGEPPDALVLRARQALQRARSLGRNAVSVAAEPVRSRSIAARPLQG